MKPRLWLAYFMKGMFGCEQPFLWGKRWVASQNTAAEETKGGETRDTKTLNLSRNIVSLQVFADAFRFSPCVPNLTRNKNIWRNAARWLVDLLGHEQICCATSCVFDEKRATNQNLLLKVDPGSSFHNNFLQPATNVFVAGQVDHARWKTGNIDENLQRNNVARQVELTVFVSRISPP